MTSVQLLSPPGQKGQGIEGRKMEPFQITISENSHEGSEIFQDLSTLPVGVPTLSKKYYAHRRPSTYYCIQAKNLRMVINVPNQGLSVLLLLILVQ